MMKKEKLKMIGVVGSYFGNGNYNVIEENIRRAESFAIALADQDIHFFCAHTHTRHFEVKARASEDFYKRQDMNILTRTCSALLVVPGWETSQGTIDEIKEFERLGRPIFYPKSPDDLDEVKKWWEEKI